jgi:hypothetical protein
MNTIYFIKNQSDLLWPLIDHGIVYTDIRNNDTFSNHRDLWINKMINKEDIKIKLIPLGDWLIEWGISKVVVRGFTVFESKTKVNF